MTKKQFIGIYDLGEHTAPHVTGKDWENLFYKYTEGTYKASHPIWTILRSTSVIKELFDNQYVGKTGLQYLVAWSIYRQLVEFTEPYRYRDGKKADEACFVHVKDVMNLAILSKFFELVVTPQMVEEVRQLAFRIKDVFIEAVQSSSWLLPSVRTRLFQKLKEIDVLVGSPGDQLEPKFVKRFYEALPDVPFNRLFPSWIQGRRLNTHYHWKDQKTKFYDEEKVTAFFMGLNTAVIPTAQLLRPFFYEYGPSALKFGGIGTKIGHTLMWGFDDAQLGSEFWKAKDVKKEYTKRVLCLRRSYRSILFVHLSDAENLADLEGAKLAYAAYNSLPEEHKRVKLAGFSASPDQLFFINYCVGWCAWHASTTKQQSPYWSRCMVPLKNMPEFSRAFSCAAGTLMNPDEKCSFW
ncbi:neprilysin-2-like [Rhipicephalus microplus]|uniref:neprilysin-2-like n=1 Tax=Rhipicephalus microplus TaxID=6941 RepID=UPI003F6AA951